MARIRKFCAYRRIERPYTRRSKFREKSFIKANPVSKVIRYDMGDLKKKFPYRLCLKTKSHLQIRHNALEAARQTTNRHLEKYVGKSNFHFKIAVYPHHVLRENPIAVGAGADRMSTGMKMSFGKPIGIAAQLRKGQTVFYVETSKNYLAHARNALRKASTKMPCTFSIVEEKLS